MDNKHETDEELIRRYLAGDPLASTRIFERFANRLKGFLRSRWPYASDDELHDAMTEALLAIFQHPERWDSNKSQLFTYLSNIAWRKMSSLHQKASRQLEIFAKQSVGEFDRIVNTSSGGNPEKEFISAETLDRILQWICQHFPTEPDQTFVMMAKVEKIKDTGPYAELLGIAHLPFPEQQKKVEQHKDRLHKQLKRKGFFEFLNNLK